jgi:cell wall-associated NlpC family hydrolase
MTEYDQRQAVVAETRRWIGTPYVPGADLRGTGVDCGMLLVRVFQTCGYIEPEFDPRPYPIQWHFHQAAERYLGIVERFAQPLPLDREPAPGDVVLFKFGKCFSHGAIIESWPTVIHAMRPYKVGRLNVLATPKLARLERRFFTTWP